MEKRLSRMKEFAINHMLGFIGIALACIVLNNMITGVFEHPFENNMKLKYLMMAVNKIIPAMVLVFLMKKWDLSGKSSKKQIVLAFLMGIPCIIGLGINVVPLVLVPDRFYRVQWSALLASMLAYFGVGLLEEAGCRGILLPLLCEKWANRKNRYMQAAFVSALLFGFGHLSWLIRALVFQGDVSVAQCIDRLYQVYFTFCFGILAAGVTLYAKSIVPMVIWHALFDFITSIPELMLSGETYYHFFIKKSIGLDDVLIQKGIIQSTGKGYHLFLLGLYAIEFIAGIIIIRYCRKRDCSREVMI